MTGRAWTEAHVAAFEFFGGVPAKLTPDNLKDARGADSH
jgi:transposase